MQESTKQAMSDKKAEFKELMEKNPAPKVIAAFLVAVGETMLQYELSLSQALNKGNKMNLVARMAENGIDMQVAEYYVFGTGSMKRLAKSLFKKQARAKGSKLFAKHLVKFKHIFGKETAAAE